MATKIDIPFSENSPLLELKRQIQQLFASRGILPIDGSEIVEMRINYREKINEVILARQDEHKKND